MTIKRINAVYNYGGGGDKGLQYLYKEISQLVGFEPDYQVSSSGGRGRDRGTPWAAVWFRRAPEHELRRPLSGPVHPY